MTILTARLADKNRNRTGVTDAVLRVGSPALTDAAGRVLYQGGYEDVPFSSDGTVTLDLLPTDTPGTNPSAWSYTFQVRYRLDGQRRSMPRFAAQVTGDTIDLASLQPQGTTDPVFVPPVNFQAAYAETLTARDGAVSARDAAVVARGAAESARDAALAQNFRGFDLGTLDLNTITTPGLYRQATGPNATLARNYPPTAVGGAGSLEVLNVLGDGGFCIQRFTIHGGINNLLRVVYQRRWNGSAWTSWTTYLSTRVSQPANQPGVELFVHDDVNVVERQVPVVGLALGSQDLNTVTAVGVYAQGTGANVTTANNYPVTYSAGGVLEIIPMGSFRLQRWTFVSSAAGSGRSIWQRTWNGSTWSSWRELTEQRADRAAGLAIYSNYAADRSQLVYADTGWRDVSANLANDWAGTVLVRRFGYRVVWRFTLDSTNATSTALLTAGLGAGWRPLSGGNTNFALRPASGNGNVWSSIAGSTAMPQVSTGITMSGNANEMSYATTDAWPTALPGVAAGSIPTD